MILRKLIDSGWIWVLVGLLVVLAACAHAGSVTIVWSAPTTNTDGSVIPPTGLAALSIYQVEYAPCPTIATANFANAQAPTVAAPALTMTISGLGVGQWCFHVRAENFGGQLSSYSGVMAASPVQPTPKAPANVMVAALAVYNLRHGVNEFRQMLAARQP